MRNPLYRAFIDAGIEAGYVETEDYNGYRQEGFGQKFMNVDAGIRASTSHAYLKQQQKRSNLSILKRSLVRRILFEDKTAVGIEYKVGNRIERVTANKEVILCAGAIGSPIYTGVWRRSFKVLGKAGIEVLHELPGVGENLQDHLEFNFQYRCKQPISLNSQLACLRKR